MESQFPFCAFFSVFRCKNKDNNKKTAIWTQWATKIFALSCSCDIIESSFSHEGHIKNPDNELWYDLCECKVECRRFFIFSLKKREKSENTLGEFIWLMRLLGTFDILTQKRHLVVNKLSMGTHQKLFFYKTKQSLNQTTNSTFKPV